jgi:lipopolysaccharide/colanic/teichoic acid biosynthesis glycosyltransferase
LDAVIAATMLALMLPLLGLIAMLIRLESPGPIFFRARRVGYRGRPLEMLKFRKMHHAAVGSSLTVGDDERFTRIGAVLARFKLDELPQLWNVLRGDMSIVGPRPENQELAAQHARAHAEITQVKPGIIGLSQLAFAEESRILDEKNPLNHYLGSVLPEKLKLDRLYIQKWSLWLDVQIMFWAVVVVILRRPVAVHRRDGRMNLRRRGRSRRSGQDSLADRAGA